MGEGQLQVDTVVRQQFLMSKDFLKGYLQDALEIICNVQPNPPSNERKKMSVAILEFAPFASSTDYCIYTGASPNPLICSGSRTFYTDLGPFWSSEGGTFTMRLKDSAVEVPQLRYWISINREYFLCFPSLHLVITQCIMTDNCKNIKKTLSRTVITRELSVI